MYYSCILFTYGVFRNYFDHSALVGWYSTWRPLMMGSMCVLLNVLRFADAAAE